MTSRARASMPTCARRVCVQPATVTTAVMQPQSFAPPTRLPTRTTLVLLLLTITCIALVSHVTAAVAAAPTRSSPHTPLPSTRSPSSQTRFAAPRVTPLAALGLRNPQLLAARTLLGGSFWRDSSLPLSSAARHRALARREWRRRLAEQRRQERRKYKLPNAAQRARAIRKLRQRKAGGAQKATAKKKRAGKNKRGKNKNRSHSRAAAVQTKSTPSRASVPKLARVGAHAPPLPSLSAPERARAAMRDLHRQSVAARKWIKRDSNKKQHAHKARFQAVTSHAAAATQQQAHSHAHAAPSAARLRAAGMDSSGPTRLDARGLPLAAPKPLDATQRFHSLREFSVADLLPTASARARTQAGVDASIRAALDAVKILSPRAAAGSGGGGSMEAQEEELEADLGPGPVQRQWNRAGAGGVSLAEQRASSTLPSPATPAAGRLQQARSMVAAKRHAQQVRRQADRMRQQRKRA